jgi:putative spermidine/putrescine transport system ATP-binding protein
MQATGLTLSGISHRYAGQLAVADVNLEVKPGEMIALLGPSGCGKTTLLRIVAGLMRQSEGNVVIGEKIVDALPTNERGAGIVFQNYALFPHMTVAANVGYGLRAAGVEKAKIAETVARMLALVKLEAMAQRYPRQLSGGQQQRVALARTLAVSPKLLLLDEPFGALDKNLRLDMQIEVKRLQRELGITTLMVTHDQEEALSMADRIAVMSRGKVEQFGTPEEVYDAPESLFVAGFVGTTNLLPGTLVTDGPDPVVELAAGGAIAVPVARPCSSPGPVVLSVRPEHLRFAAAGEGGVEATLRLSLPLGALTVYELALGDGTPVKLIAQRGSAGPRPAPGERVRLALIEGSLPAVFRPDVVAA